MSVCTKSCKTTMRICREFENWRNLRTLSGKFLRQKSCYPESLRFLWLCVNVRCCMVPCVRQDSFRAGAPTVSFTYFLPHPLTHVCTTRHRSVVLPIVNHLLTFVLRYIFTTPIHLHLAKGFCLSVTKIARDGQAFSSRLFKLSVLCAHGPGTST